MKNILSLAALALATFLAIAPTSHAQLRPLKEVVISGTITSNSLEDPTKLIVTRITKASLVRFFELTGVSANQTGIFIDTTNNNYVLGKSDGSAIYGILIQNSSDTTYNTGIATSGARKSALVLGGDFLGGAFHGIYSGTGSIKVGKVVSQALASINVVGQQSASGPNSSNRILFMKLSGRIPVPTSSLPPQ